ncbi:uncharacterized protein METZ01_LOCUS287704, partial [marine metagenome]
KRILRKASTEKTKKKERSNSKRGNKT